MEKDLNRKARLILGGDVLIPKDFEIPVRISRSTAGPGAGKRSLVFAFDGMRVKKSISYDEGEFELRDDGGRLSIWNDGRVFIDEVRILPVVYHSPEQAFFNLDQRCIFRCVFCASPLLGVDATKDLTDDKIVSMIRSAERVSEIPSVALTSGVVGSVRETVDRMASCVRRLRREFPDKIIGVEPYVDSEEQIRQLKDAGADEIKINRETARDDIFRKVCPDLDRQRIFEMLEHSVRVFGKGHVASNVIYGMGESDDDVVGEMEMLASAGCIPGLRALKINDANRENLVRILGELEPVTPERMVRLAEEQKIIMERHGLDTNTFRTMCFACQCCDIVPFRDL